MNRDLLDLYDQASEWTLDKVGGAVKQMDAPTPCEGWDVRTLMNHMLATQRYFVGSARGDDVSPPAAEPAELLSSDPRKDFRQMRDTTHQTFAEEGVIEQTGPTLGIAFADQLLHGWDLAQATGQDTRMPPGLPEAAFEMIHGRFTDDQCKGVFKPAVDVGPDASAQEKLLAYTGRQPNGTR